jgi:hypothetical protein
VEVYRQYCWIARDHQQFEQGVEQALRSASPARRRELSDAMRGETWQRRVIDLGQQVMRIKKGPRP